MRKKRHVGVFQQLALFFIFAGMLPIALLGVSMYIRVSALAQQELTRSYELLATQYFDSVEKELTQYETSIMYIAKNTVINEQMLDEENDLYARGQMISNEVFKCLISEDQTAIRDCHVYSALGETPVYGKSVSMTLNACRERWFAAWSGEMGRWFFYNDPEDAERTLGVIVYPIFRTDLTSLRQERIGFAKLELYLDRLAAPAERGEEGFQAAVFDETMRNFYRTDSLEQEQAAELLRLLREKGWVDGSVRIADGQIMCARHIGGIDLDFLLFFGRDGLHERRRETAAMLIPLILLVAGVACLLCYFFAGRFSGRVNQLVDKFKRAETGDLSVTAPISGSDELTVLDAQFSHMLEQINELIRVNYIQELEKKETELKNLQLQINPHFLYNTLETISSTAAVRQAFTVCDLCGRLGEIFRYSLGKDYGEYVTVEQEIHHVDNYVFIQKVRYKDKFDVTYRIDPAVQDCLLLRFILQPIVENAIQHGIVPKQGKGTICIEAHRQADTLCVRVEDDGVGMDAARQKELESYINREESDVEEQKSIGVRNVHRRIRLACGEMYGITIASEPDKGSCFLITLPLRGGNEEKEDGHV